MEMLRGLCLVEGDTKWAVAEICTKKDLINLVCLWEFDPEVEIT
jgi:hypothetical protein